MSSYHTQDPQLQNTGKEPEGKNLVAYSIQFLHNKTVVGKVQVETGPGLADVSENGCRFTPALARKQELPGRLGVYL